MGSEMCIRDRFRSILRNDVSFVRFRLETAGFSTTMGYAERIETARGVLETIAAIEDPLRRDLLIEELGSITELRREALDQALERIKPRRDATDTDTLHRTSFEIPRESIAERDLMHALLGHPETAREFVPRLTPDRFHHPPLRELFRIYEQAYLKEETVDTTTLPDRFDDPSVRAFIAAAVMDGRGQSTEEARCEIRGCIDAIEIRDINEERRQLELRINRAEKEGKPTREFLRRLVQLNERLRKLQGNVAPTPDYPRR